MKTTEYAKQRRKDAFRHARQAIAVARESKTFTRDEVRSVIAFWRNEAAYYIRKPA